MQQFSTAFLYFIAFFASCNLSFGQEESLFNLIEPEKSIDQLLSENVRYPSKALQDRKEGSVLLSLKINAAGFIDSLFIIESTDEIFKNEALLAVGILESKWSPELLKEKPTDRKYLLFFKFDTFLNEASPNERVKQAEKLIEKEKFKKALKVLDKLIAENPYQVNTHELRWQVNLILSETVEAQKDYLKIKYLEKEFLSVVEVFAIGSTRSGVPISF